MAGTCYAILPSSLYPLLTETVSYEISKKKKLTVNCDLFSSFTWAVFFSFGLFRAVLPLVIVFRPLGDLTHVSTPRCPRSPS